MNNSMLLINNVESVLVFLVTFLALWISGRIILRNYSRENWILSILLWLSIGGLLIIPLVDLIRYLSYFLYLIIPSSDKYNPASVFLGNAPYLYYSTISLVLGVAVYSLALYFTQKVVDRRKLPFIQGYKISNWEYSFILLGIAGLINRAVGGIVVNFVTIYIPSLTAQLDQTKLTLGFWISWLIGFIVLIVTLVFMSELLNRRKNQVS